MWSNGVALASKTSVKASARLCRKLQRCPIPRCFSLATKVMHIINPYTCNTLRRFVHVYMDFRSSTGRLFMYDFKVKWTRSCGTERNVVLCYR